MSRWRSASRSTRRSRTASVRWPPTASWDASPAPASTSTRPRPARAPAARDLPSSTAMRIASLVPSSTELLFALGAGDSVVAVTHECDYPAEAAERPHLTRSVVPEGLTAAGIDAAVRDRTTAGLALYELDETRLA